MKICITSHSNIALRQQLCWKELSKYAEVLVISPKKWNNLSTESVKEGNYELFADNVYSQNQMYDFTFSSYAFEKIRQFKPDIIYNQNEICAKNTILMLDFAERMGAKFVEFTWENIKEPSVEDKYNLEKCDLIIAGNSEAKKLYYGNLVLPQVGLDLSRFKPNPNKEIDVAFFGRYTKEKGCDYIKEAYPDTLFVTGKPYDEVSELMGKTKISVSYPFDTEFWKEQWSSFVAIESMASGAIFIMSDTSSAKEYLEDSPAIIVPMYRPDLLKERILWILENYNLLSGRIERGIEFSKKFSNGYICKLLIEEFEKLLEKK